ncbi:MAG: LPS translocon maturation chaperone LptM [Legionella sp.]
MKQIHYTLIICIVLLLSGCGQKGPLYLPEPTKNTANQ